MRSRLKTNVRKQSLHIIIGIVVIVVVLLFFGTELLIGFSAILEKLKGSDQQVTDTTNVDYVAPPILNPVNDATSQNSVDITGYVTSDDMVVELFVNDSPVGKEEPESDNSFSFHSVVLENGKNEIKARTLTANGKHSDYSQPLMIRYLSKEPKLEVATPANGQVFKKDQSPIRISGQTDPGAKVTVNDFWAITQEDGDFYYDYSLKDGDNNLKIVSTDEAGNISTKELNIKAE